MFVALLVANGKDVSTTTISLRM